MYCAENKNQPEIDWEEQENERYTVTDALKKWGVDVEESIEKGEEK